MQYTYILALLASSHPQLPHLICRKLRFSNPDWDACACDFVDMRPPNALMLHLWFQRSRRPWGRTYATLAWLPPTSRMRPKPISLAHVVCSLCSLEGTGGDKHLWRSGNSKGHNFLPRCISDHHLSNWTPRFKELQSDAYDFSGNSLGHWVLVVLKGTGND